MEKKKLYEALIERKSKGLKSFAVLIDPDKVRDWTACAKLINMSVENKVDFFFVGGSLLTNMHLNKVITLIKSNSNIPVVLFPGSNMHINTAADGILFLSLLSKLVWRISFMPAAQKKSKPLYNDLVAIFHKLNT